MHDLEVALSSTLLDIRLFRKHIDICAKLYFNVRESLKVVIRTQAGVKIVEAIVTAYHLT